RGPGHPAAGRGPGVLRRLRPRLVDRSPGRRAWTGARVRNGSATGLGLGCGLAVHETFRGRLHEALVRAEADDRGGPGLVHRRGGPHGAVRPPPTPPREHGPSRPPPARPRRPRPPPLGVLPWAPPGQAPSSIPRRGSPPPN